MPIIRSAKKKQRQDAKRYVENLMVKNALKKSVKAFRASPSTKAIPALFKSIDTAAKKNVIHANKSARLKSRLSKLLAKTKKSTA